MLRTEITYWKTIAASIGIGVITGFIVSLYRYLVENSANYITICYSTVKQHWFAILILFVLLAIAGLLCGRIVAINRYVLSGSGVPQTQIGMSVNPPNRNWLKLLSLKILGGILCLGAGLSLGREGPSVQIGAMTGRLLKDKFSIKIDSKLVLGCGAGAGLAAALNAPLAGTMFAIEELFKKISPLTLICVLLSSITSTVVVERIFGIAPLFTLQKFPVPSLSEYPLFVAVGVISGFAGVLFCSSCLWCSDKFANINWKFKFVAIFLLTGIAGLFAPEILGVREGMILKYSDLLAALYILGILFMLKWLFTILSIASSAPGGIFVPLIGIGLFLGIFLSKLFVLIGISVSAEMIIALTMGGYFVAVIRAPLTAIVLVAEVTDSFVCFLPLAVVAIAAMLTADLFDSEPIYESIIERMHINKKESV